MPTITDKTKHLDELHFEHQLWLSEARFYADELRIYENRLEEIAAKNTKAAVRKWIEQFQNKFKIQKEQLDILNNEVNMHEQWLARYAKEHPIDVDHELFADHKVMLAKMQLFSKLYNQLKLDFQKFMTVWM